MYRFILIFIVAFSTMQLFSQTIEGIVINSGNKKPVADANIVIKNSTLGTDYFIKVSCDDS